MENEKEIAIMGHIGIKGFYRGNTIWRPQQMHKTNCAVLWEIAMTSLDLIADGRDFKP